MSFERAAQQYFDPPDPKPQLCWECDHPLEDHHKGGYCERPGCHCAEFDEYDGMEEEPPEVGDAL